MAHEIATDADGRHQFLYAKGTDEAWHRLGRPIDVSKPPETWLSECGADFFVEKRPLYTRAGEFDTIAADKYERSSLGDVLVRTDTGDALAHVSKRYVPTQNATMLEFFREYIIAGYCELNTMGVLRKGAIFFALAKFNSQIVLPGDDVIDNYLLLTADHRPGHANIVMPTDIRVVCSNTWHAATAAGEKRAIARHQHRSVFTEQKQQEVKFNLGITTAQVELRRIQYEAMASTPVRETQVHNFVADLVGLEDQPRHDQNRAYVKVRDLFDGDGMGSDLQSSRGTVWGLFNAVTEFVDHHRGRESTRVEQSLVGAGADIKEDASLDACSLADVA